MSTLRIAWRNIRRNSKRTLVTVVAVALNTAVLMTTFALMEGTMRQLVDNVTHLLVGDIQVHAEGYRQDRSLYKDIPDAASLLAQVEERGALAAPRAYGFGLVSSGPKSAGATFWGVIPEAERRAFRLADKLAHGRWLDSETRGTVVVGTKLARSLKLVVGSELIAVVQAADGSLGNELFRVAGILRTVGEDIDRGAVLMHGEEFDRLFAAAGRVHELAINANGADPERLTAAFAAHGAGLDIASWRQLSPTIAQMVELSRASMFLFAVIFFLAAGLGVLNTMLMATHDRVREYGMIKAMGATPWRIIKDVAAEALVLSLLATSVGGVVGALGSIALEIWGLDLSGMSGTIAMEGVALDPVWRAALTVRDAVFSIVAMCTACVVAALYPAVRAARLDPVRAMTRV